MIKRWWTVKVTQLVETCDLCYDDSEGFLADGKGSEKVIVAGEFDYENDVLDWFHWNYPLSRPEHYLIEAELNA